MIPSINLSRLSEGRRQPPRQVCIPVNMRSVSLSQILWILWLAMSCHYQKDQNHVRPTSSKDVGLWSMCTNLMSGLILFFPLFCFFTAFFPHMSLVHFCLGYFTNFCKLPKILSWGISQWIILNDFIIPYWVERVLTDLILKNWSYSWAFI